MKKILKNFWVPALIALIASLLSWIGSFWFEIGNLIPKRRVPTVKEEAAKFWDFRTKEIDNLAIQLKVANLAFQKKEEQFKVEENRINAERVELLRLKDEINRLQMELSQRILTAEAGEQKNLKMLANTYTNMAPAAVVVIFKEMDDNLIVKIMSFMPAETIGPILQAMADSPDKKADWPKRAAKLSEILRLNQTRNS
ncbi:MAG: hypothetical protein A2007_03135 [Verrucomicrobia bacterium GWC2_42_7]|nr:MAG: hypothetical protein A2007_03135 [Verrucomicrobia bacterium GWC2_42_7]